MNKALQRGFSLINVLITVLVFSLGLLALGAVYGRLVDVQTQNQNLMWMAPWSNGFWGIVQANPGVLASLTNVTYTSANVSAAPAPLQNWLGQVTTAASSPAALPNASVQIQTGPDAGTGNTCATAITSPTGCSVTLTIRWSQNGTTQNRSQIFYYQFGGI